LKTPAGDGCGVARDLTWQVRANNRLCERIHRSGPPLSAGSKDEIFVIAKTSRADATFRAYGQVPGDCEPVVVWRTSSDSDGPLVVDCYSADEAEVYRSGSSSKAEAQPAPQKKYSVTPKTR
jgi:hypothetical protein